MNESSPSHCCQSEIHRTRVVLAKVGLDGHDRGIKVVARGLRDAGFHVIYSGLWQSPEAVARIVADEDADWLGISLLNGAHLTLIPRVAEALRQVGRRDVGFLVGGIIPPADIPRLRQHGVDAVFGPGTTITEIVASCSARKSLPISLDDLIDRTRQRDRVALARLLTLASDPETAMDVRSRFPEVGGLSGMRRIAVTGSPGVGKSSLIGRLLKSFQQQSTSRIAVLACDPQSPVTGGALLGDRLRMADSTLDENLFIHSLATPSGTQGIAPALDVMERILALSGFDLLIIETVGIGQGEIAVRSLADHVILVLQPQTGDSVQWDKAGLWELADLIVVQKCDLTGADEMLAGLREHLVRADGTTVPIVGVSSHDSAGWGALFQTLSGSLRVDLRSGSPVTEDGVESDLHPEVQHGVPEWRA
ncbi:cobalamin-dependent protein [Schlesneria paludicola]|uniref:cobalamin-dependent protein n=1 Tax=Schlesneria paludicola TaxID=360056 RepID=UPI00029B163A|nr:cobalamin-dependent protein [Schlesneria paludicola]